MAKARVQNRLAEIRRSCGLGAAELARRVNASRQTIYAIESGAYVPNTELALELARELEVGVQDLFSLSTTALTNQDTIDAELLSAAPPATGQPVRICRVGERRVASPVLAAPYYIPEADAVIERVFPGGTGVKLTVAQPDEDSGRIIIAGCDPATGLLTAMAGRHGGVEIIAAAASSSLALAWLKEGKVHIAGSHLEDLRTGEFNVPIVREQFSGEEMLMVTFAQWEDGWVVGSGNPKGIRGPEDLARKGVSIVNREHGSGSRALLDRLLKNTGVSGGRIRGYDRVAAGHLAAAQYVALGEADVCLATRPAARAFGLTFIPLHTARYDFVMRKQTAELPAVKAFLDILQRAQLRRKLEMMAGYDTSRTGTVVS